MRGREIVEGQQLFSVFDQAFGSLWVFRLECINEQINGGMRIVAGLCLPNVGREFQKSQLIRLQHEYSNF